MNEASTSPGGPGKSCFCPYCENEEPLPFPFCSACGKPIDYCDTCNTPLPKGASTCPGCGRPMGGTEKG